MIKFGHIGDIHLGEKYPQGGLDRLKEIRNRGIKAFKWMVKRDVDFILMPGDIFDTPRPGEFARVAFARMIEPALSMNIPLVIIPGQHDKVTDDLHAHLGMRALVEAIGGSRIYFVDTVDGFAIHKEVYLVCQPWERNIDPAKWVEPSQVKSQCSYNILMGHFPVKGGIVGPVNYKMGTGISKSAFKGFDYVALADYHNGNQDYYCGSLARLNFGERNEEHGFKWVQLKHGKVKSKLVAIPDRAFYVTEFTWKESSTPELINDRLKDLIHGLDLDLDDCNLKIVVNVPEEVSRVVDEQMLRKFAHEKYGVRNLIIKWELQRRELTFSRVESLGNKEPSEVLEMSSKDMLRAYVQEKWKGKPGTIKRRVFEEGAKLL